jgi:hypothetical protein
MVGMYTYTYTYIWRRCGAWCSVLGGIFPKYLTQDPKYLWFEPQCIYLLHLTSLFVVGNFDLKNEK